MVHPQLRAAFAGAVVARGLALSAGLGGAGAGSGAGAAEREKSRIKKLAIAWKKFIEFPSLIKTQATENG